MENYFGLIEMLFSASAFLAFYVWQRRSLARDIAAREAREAQERSAQSAIADGTTRNSP